MKYFLRPYRTLRSSAGTLSCAVALLGAAWGAHIVAAQSAGIAQVMETPSPLLHSAATPGYMGVLVGDVDTETATKLKLKDTHGAVITLIDHDAPAAQAGIHVNDVVLQVNGEAMESAEHFVRVLREVPPGRTVTLVISRDGNEQTIAVHLVDRKKMETAEIPAPFLRPCVALLRRSATLQFALHALRPSAAARIGHHMRQRDKRPALLFGALRALDLLLLMLDGGKAKLPRLDRRRSPLAPPPSVAAAVPTLPLLRGGRRRRAGEHATRVARLPDSAGEKRMGAEMGRVSQWAGGAREARSAGATAATRQGCGRRVSAVVK